MSCDSNSKAIAWLHSLHHCCHRPVRLTVLLGGCSGLGAIIQAGLLAHLIHCAVIDGADREWFLFALLAVVVAFRALSAWGREVCGQRSSTLVRRHVRHRLLDHFAAGGPAFVQEKQSGPLTDTVLDRVEGLHGYFAHYLPQKILALIVPITIIGIAFSVSWAVGLIFLITAPVFPLMMIMIGRGAESLNQKNFQLLSRMSAHFLDTLRGLTTLKLFQRSEEESVRIAASSESYRKGTMAVLRVAFLSSAVLEFLTSVAIAMTAVFLGLSYLHFLDFGLYGQELTLRSGLFLLMLAPELYLPLRELGTHYHARAEALGAAVELSALLLDPPAGQCRDGTKVLASADRVTLQIHELQHDFSQRGTPAIAGLSLDVQAGEWLAVVGPSGAGKTTLLNLLLGFYPVQQGKILINGVSLTDLKLDEWRRRIAWVPQQPQLFFGSLAENVALENPEMEMSQITAASRQARLLEPVGQLPRGLATPAGEQGMQLSGGQARRVALARAFTRDAALVLLDEPTAGLDLENERLIMASLKQLVKGKTVIMLTHRLDTAQLADRIVVMAGGKVVEQGTHLELIEMNGDYARLATKKKGR
ncbi:MAG: thiol reductant ABC exporter subunit CydD [Desulfopila sp.]|nr:thiol reductant ABC exporter subunit CydD [Desulfopila sp.]